jgi:hypothetical protein
MLLAGGPDGDFNVLSQSREEFHEASDRKVTRTIPHQQRDLRLLHAKNFGDFDLCHTMAIENPIDLQGELSLEHLLFGIGKTNVREDISAAFGYAGNILVCFFRFGFHFSSASLHSPARLLPAASDVDVSERRVVAEARDSPTQASHDYEKGE